MVDKRMFSYYENRFSARYYHFLEKKLDSEFTCEEVLDTLKK